MSFRSNLVMGTALVLSLTACGVTRNDGVLRQVTPGSVVYIDGWDQTAGKGDNALVEQKPSKLWVVPEDAPFTVRKRGEYVVKIQLGRDGVFRVLDLGGTLVGSDHDDCLANNELYAAVDVPQNQLRFEPNGASRDASHDDCAVAPAA